MSSAQAKVSKSSSKEAKPKKATGTSNIRPECEDRFASMESLLDNIKKGITAIKRALTTQGKSIREIEKKVYNGYDAKIDSLHTRVDDVIKNNDDAHKEIKDDVRAIRRLMIGLLISIVVGFVISNIVQTRNASVTQERVIEEVKDETSP